MNLVRPDAQEFCRRRVPRHLSRRQNPLPVSPSARRGTLAEATRWAIQKSSVGAGDVGSVVVCSVIGSGIRSGMDRRHDRGDHQLACRLRDELAAPDFGISAGGPFATEPEAGVAAFSVRDGGVADCVRAVVLSRVPLGWPPRLSPTAGAIVSLFIDADQPAP